MIVPESLVLGVKLVVAVILLQLVMVGSVSQQRATCDGLVKSINNMGSTKIARNLVALKEDIVGGLPVLPEHIALVVEVCVDQVVTCEVLVYVLLTVLPVGVGVSLDPRPDCVYYIKMFTNTEGCEP